MRVLGVLRLSRSTEVSTSLERQRESIELWARLNGHDVIGWAEDDGVSGATSPFARDGFGPWLDEEGGRLESYDIACAWKLDRFGRSVSEFLKLSDFLNGHGKQIATTDGTVDTTTPQGRFFTTLLSAMAEWERDMISMRALSSQAKLRAEGRWHGGPPPYGYRTAPNSKGKGKRLEPHPEQAEVVRFAVRLRLKGKTYQAIADAMNQQGYKTAQGHKWIGPRVQKVLTTRRIVGQRITSDGKLVTDGNGEPVLFGEPLITEKVFAELQAVQEERTLVMSPITSTYLLKGLITCGTCALPMYRKISARKRRYYACSSPSRGVDCSDHPNVPAELLEEVFEGLFLDTKGGERVMERRFVKGSDNTQRLERLQANINRLMKEADMGAWDGMQDEYLSKLGNLTEERKRLAALPQQPDRFIEVPTEKTFAQVWEESDTEERRKLLHGIGVEVKIFPEDFDTRKLQPVDGKSLALTTPVGLERNRKLLFVAWGQPNVEALEPEPWQKLYDSLSRDELLALVNEGKPEDEQVLDPYDESLQDTVIELLKRKAAES